MNAAVPARLHVLLARNAPFGVVIRRGPSKSTAFVGWNRSDDTFLVAQWLRGRVYERRSDLSPDGQHLIYFAMNGIGRSQTGGSWTAISRAPYMKALTLYGKGDCWNGGGLFRDDRSYWLNDGPYTHNRLRNDAPVRRVDVGEDGLGECPGVYYERLVRDGWTAGDWRRDGSGGAIVAFDKPVSHRWRLRKHAHATSKRRIGRGCYFDTHELVGHAGRVEAKDDWEWADVVDGRLVWAAAGVLHARRIRRDGHLGPEIVLKDFNGMTFARLRAPY